MGKYSIVNDPETFDNALKLCRGCYQRNLLYGEESLSGATLTGKAKRYIGRYRNSGLNLIRRCRQAGLTIRETRGKNNKRILVIG